jgi:hypothetical protein
MGIRLASQKHLDARRIQAIDHDFSALDHAAMVGRIRPLGAQPS